jgi:hypothetical protein
MHEHPSLPILYGQAVGHGGSQSILSNQLRSIACSLVALMGLSRGQADGWAVEKNMFV